MIHLERKSRVRPERRDSPTPPYNASILPPRASSARFALLALLLAAAAVPAPAAAPREVHDAATPRWDQFGGNASRTFASSVEPVRSEPRVAWEGDRMENPVAWEGTVYSTWTGAPTGGCTVRGVSLADGKVLATTRLNGTRSAHLAVAGGMLVVATQTGLYGYQLQGTGFTRRWTVKGSHDLPPAVLDGVVYSISESGLVGYDPRNGKVVSEGVPLDTQCPPVVHGEGKTVQAAGVFIDGIRGYVGKYAHLSKSDGRGREFGRLRGDPERVEGLRLTRIPGADFGPGAWLLHSPVPFMGVESDLHGAIMPGGGEGGLAPVAYPVPVYRDRASGFSRAGRLVSVTTEGHYFELVKEGGLPRGARPGPATRARSTGYFGNWALDLDSDRVLWSLPELKSSRPLLPVADRVLLAFDEIGRVRCLTDLPPAAPPVDGNAKAAASAPAAAAPPPPPSGDGLLLADGTFLEGAVEVLPGGRYRVRPVKGGMREEAAAEILLARGGGEVLHRGRGSAVLATWRRALHPAARATLMEIHGRVVRDGLHEPAAAVIADARAFGLAEEEAAAATRRALGVKANVVPDRAFARLEPEILGSRSAAREPFLAAAAWCGEREFHAAAACLLLAARRMLPGDGVPEARAAATVPPSFPWRESTDAVPRWLAWAPELASADGAFVPRDDPLRRSIREGPWSGSGEALVLRTPNTVFRTPVRDPAVVGRCLRNAEFTCGALTLLLGPDAVLPVTGDDDLMDIRLHADEEAYRRENAAAGNMLTWSAGHYTPSEGVSRFFVPDAEQSDPLGRGLFEVLAHELTHHFLDRRWVETAGRRRGGPGVPGYWAVEGIARFVEDQTVEMDRRGLRFDDRTVPSLEAAAQASKKGVIYRPSELLGLSHAGFGRLTTKTLLTVTLKNTLQERILSQIGLFYEQAGAITWFLVMDREEEGRRAFFRYLSDVYGGRAPVEGWRSLGFSSAEEFDGAFLKFLGGIR